MALTRSGAPAPTSSVSNAQALANRSVQNANRAGSTAMQAASPSVPVEITAADGQHLVVSFDEVRRFICDKATDTECKIFLETCKQYKLNPFTKEAYLIHYDNKNDETASTIVLGKNCYLQMAERNPNFDGFEAGVIVLTADGQLLNREGSIVYDGDGGETLLGGWAKVYRKDRTRASYEEVKLSEYDTGKSLWSSKKATMIRKVALVQLATMALGIVAGLLAVVAPAGLMMTGITMLTTIVSYVVTITFMSALLALLYIDVRMRREGLDVELAAAAARETR